MASESSSLLTKKWSFFFDLMDHDKNGVWNLKDFVLFSEKIYTIYAVNNYYIDANQFLYKARRIFNHLRKEMGVESSNITKENWINFLQEKDKEPGRKYFRFMVSLISKELFDVCDQNKDDYLSEYELIQLYKMLGLVEETAVEAIDLLDLNKDYRISKFELHKGIRDFFEDPDKEETLFGRVYELRQAQIVE